MMSMDQVTRLAEQYGVVSGDSVTFCVAGLMNFTRTVESNQVPKKEMAIINVNVEGSILELQGILELVEAAKKFVARVESGEVRSKTSYTEFTAALLKIETNCKG